MDNQRSDAADANLAIVRRVYEEGLNQGNFSLLDQLIDEKIEDHSLYPVRGSGRGAFVERFRSVRSAFPDANMTIEDGVATGDKVVCRWILRGTNTGPFASIPATGRHVVITGINISRVEGGRIVEHWASFDHLGMLQQLGVMSPYQQRPSQ